MLFNLRPNATGFAFATQGDSKAKPCGANPVVCFLTKLNLLFKGSNPLGSAISEASFLPRVLACEKRQYPLRFAKKRLVQLCTGLFCYLCKGIVLGSAEQSDTDLYQDKHTPYTHIGYLRELMGIWVAKFNF